MSISNEIFAVSISEMRGELIDNTEIKYFSNECCAYRYAAKHILKAFLVQKEDRKKNGYYMNYITFNEGIGELFQQEEYKEIVMTQNESYGYFWYCVERVKIEE